MSAENNIVRAATGNIKQGLVAVFLGQTDTIGAAVAQRCIWEFSELLCEYMGRDAVGRYLWHLGDVITSKGPAPIIVEPTSPLINSEPADYPEEILFKATPPPPPPPRFEMRGVDFGPLIPAMIIGGLLAAFSLGLAVAR